MQYLQYTIHNTHKLHNEWQKYRYYFMAIIQMLTGILLDQDR